MAKRTSTAVQAVQVYRKSGKRAFEAFCHEHPSLKPHSVGKAGLSDLLAQLAVADGKTSRCKELFSYACRYAPCKDVFHAFTSAFAASCTGSNVHTQGDVLRKLVAALGDPQETERLFRCYLSRFQPTRHSRVPVMATA